MLGGIQEWTVAGLNLLEWAGLLALAGGLGFAAWRGWAKWGRRVGPSKPKAETAPPVTAATEFVPDQAQSVLVVDDDPVVLKAHARLIASFGYKVSEALSCDQAVAAVQKAPPDLVVLDLLMPDQDGIETFRAIRTVCPDQKAIVVSGYAGPSMVNSIQALGVHTYLIKPVERSILGKAIRDELDRAA